MTHSTPVGLPYHQLARNAEHRWWRPLAGTAGLIVLFFGAGVIALGLETVLYGISAGTFTGLNLDAPGPTPTFKNATLDMLFGAALDTLVLLAMLAAVFGVAKDVQKRPPGTLSSVAGRVRWRWLAVSLGVAAGFSAVLVGAGLLVGSSVDGSAITNTMSSEDISGGWAQIAELSQLIFWIVLAEYIFRGWFLQAVGACTPNAVFRTPWPAIVLSAALFTAVVDYGGEKLGLFVFAVVAGWVAVRTGGIESAIGLAVVYVVGQGLRTADGTGFAWQHVITIGSVVMFAAVAVWLATRLHIQTRSAGGDPDFGDASAPPAVTSQRDG